MKRKRKRNKNVFRKAISALLVVIIPVTVFCAASNIILRVPDLYQYELSSTEVLSKVKVDVNEEELVELFSGFMKGKVDKFQLKEDIGYKPADLFNKQDMQAMENLKRLLDIMLIIAIALLLITIAIYIILLRRGEKELVKKRFNGALVVFIGIAVLNALTKLISPLYGLIFGKLFYLDFPKDDLLVQILETSFRQHLLFWESIIAAVIMGIFWYVTWSLTKERTLFYR